MMTEENRRNLQKIARDMAEDAKVSVRSIRAEFHKNIQKVKADKTEFVRMLSSDSKRSPESYYL